MHKWSDSDTSEQGQNIGEKRFFGLDYGTSRSLMAYVPQGGKPVALVPHNQACRKGIPSLMAYRPKKSPKDMIPEIMVCDQVVTWGLLAADPEGVVQSVKMNLKEEDLQIHGKNFKTKEIMKMQMNRMVQLSLKELETIGSVGDANKIVQVLTVGVPVRVGERERRITEEAARGVLPGAKILLLQEPYAAALYAKSVCEDIRKVVLVYDMGAGTFDTCVLVPNENITPEEPCEFRSVYADGNRVGGDRLDLEMEEEIIETLEANGSDVNLSILRDLNHRDRRALRSVAREAKEALSDPDTPCTFVNVSGKECGNDTVVITREAYEKRIRPILAEAVEISANCLRQAKMWGEKDLTILMVGGSSLIPLARTLIKETFHWVKDEDIICRLPDQAIALGCALYAERPLVEPKVAYGYAVAAYLKGTDRKILHVQIPANCKLPYTVTNRYETRIDNQRCIAFQIYEVADAKPNDILAIDLGHMTRMNMEHDFKQPVPAHSGVIVRTTLDQNGILRMISEPEDKRLGGAGMLEENLGIEYA